MAAGHIEPRVGNLLLIALTGAAGTLLVLSTAVWLHKHGNVPILSPIASATLVVVKEAVA